jgi:hypothetical protein
MVAIFQKKWFQLVIFVRQNSVSADGQPGAYTLRQLNCLWRPQVLLHKRFCKFNVASCIMIYSVISTIVLKCKSTFGQVVEACYFYANEVCDGLSFVLIAVWCCKEMSFVSL